MSVSYKKLWKLIIDKEMSKTDLRLRAEISTNALAKLSKNKPVSVSVLDKICRVLDCSVDDIIEVNVGDKKNSSN